VTKKEPPKPVWRLFVHPAFSEPFDALVAEVARLQKSDPAGFSQHPKAKLLKRIVELIEKEIPRDPGAAVYDQGNTLGPRHRHWRRAKFLSRFRLFFRYSSKAGVIIYAWGNDENTLRKAGGGTDPYNVFGSMLRKGHPPDDWAALVKEVAAYKSPEEK
jgi:toxin YhaV